MNFANCDNEFQIYINKFIKKFNEFDNIFDKFYFNKN